MTGLARTRASQPLSAGGETTLDTLEAKMSRPGRPFYNG